MSTFSYNGPVSMFGKVVCNKFSAETMAVSDKKALINIAYQFKKQYGYVPSVAIKLEAKYLA